MDDQKSRQSKSSYRPDVRSPHHAYGLWFVFVRGFYAQPPVSGALPLSAEPSVYRGIEEFRLLQRHLATFDFSALQAAERFAHAASQSIDFAGIQAAQHTITKSVSQSINFSTLQAAAALLYSSEINSLGQIVRAWADSLNKSIDVSALHKAHAAALARLTARGYAQQAAVAAFRYQVDLSPLQEALSRAWRGIDWQQLRERLKLWIPLNLRDIRDLASVAQLSLDAGLPLAWVPRSTIVDALLASDTPQERALILDERLTDILDDCETVLVDIPHEWAKECVAAISALRAGFRGPRAVTRGQHHRQHRPSTPWKEWPRPSKGPGRRAVRWHPFAASE